MTAEAHYSDEHLIALIESRRTETEHLSACGDCRQRLDSYRLVADALRDDSVWDTKPLHEAPDPETIANLRAFADQMAHEDARAAAYLRELLAAPRESWMSTLRQHPEYRTAGMVRKLIEASERAIDTMPTDAVELAALATEVADHLDPATHGADTVHRLRGAAWRESAYAFFYTSRFSDAQAALRASLSNFSDCLVDEYDTARAGIVRSLVLRGIEQYGSAVADARASTRTFLLYGDATREMASRLAEVNLLFSAGNFEAAHSLLITLARRTERSSDADTYARVLGNLAYCCWKLGRPHESLQYFDAAAQLLNELGVETDAVRTRWSAARVLMEQGMTAEALSRLQSVAADFERFGMTNALLQVRLEIAEVLVIRGLFTEVELICRHVIKAFEELSLAHTAPALVALSLMQEAVKNKTVTPTLVRSVREYLHRIPDEPTLLFAYPPN